MEKYPVVAIMATIPVFALIHDSTLDNEEYRLFSPEVLISFGTSLQTLWDGALLCGIASAMGIFL